MKINIKKLVLSIIITFLIGNFFAIFINIGDAYLNLNKGVNVPSFIFPIVWSVIYTFMGISLYLILESKNYNKDKSIIIYFFQLLINSLWTLWFFKFHLFLFSFLWIIFLIILVIFMIINFYKINKLAGLLNILYLLWLLFAAFLNFSIVILN